ncbi:MAG: hypothetical protein CMM58_03035 [Rhodospirillaceae bacterium]|nr:hypothetical protein [Rhodospirillaceae bacterium]|tara:strand:+ start:2402 stop:3493 length:1092 start_codon:yes stop_codon:yes gene_type:complete
MQQSDNPAGWEVETLKNDTSWIFTISEKHKKYLSEVIKKQYEVGRPLFDYAAAEFYLDDLWSTLGEAFKEALHGKGLALVRGLPREYLSEGEFRLLSWVIGLHAGVARPQGLASQYIAAVRDVGTDYRASNGRGYSSNARLDFHVDGADLTALVCYNKAKAGGESMISSGITANRILSVENPELRETAQQSFYFSRQNEEAEDEAPYYGQPLFDTEGSQLFCKWNRNRVQSAQKLEGVPSLTDKQIKTMDALDKIIMRPTLMYRMYLEPGDMQILNNYTMFHSRTHYEDFQNEQQKRCLFRLWLTPPDAIRMPSSWRVLYRSIEPATVRGGIRGQQYDAACKSFEEKQALFLNMKIDNRAHLE